MEKVWFRKVWLVQGWKKNSLRLKCRISFPKIGMYSRNDIFRRRSLAAFGHSYWFFRLTNVEPLVPLRILQLTVKIKENDILKLLILFFICLKSFSDAPGKPISSRVLHDFTKSRLIVMFNIVKVFYFHLTREELFIKKIRIEVDYELTVDLEFFSKILTIKNLWGTFIFEKVRLVWDEQGRLTENTLNTPANRYPIFFKVRVVQSNLFFSKVDIYPTFEGFKFL